MESLKVQILAACLLFCCLADVATSYICVVEKGNDEQNPFMDPFVRNPAEFSLIKLCYVVTVVSIAYYLRSRVWKPLGMLFVWWSLVLQLACVFVNLIVLSA